MRILKTNPLLGLANSYLVDSPQPSTLNYFWNFGSLLGITLILQIISGIFLGMHYNSSADLAFISVEHIVRDVNYGWLIRTLHANGASFFFIFMYLHIARGLYYSSYKAPRVLLWSIGVIILIVTIVTAFLGYCLPYGQMSHWGATVIINLLSAIPWLGTSITEFIWGGFSVSGPTISRFFALHYLFPFIIAGLVVAHLIALHEHGSSNPLGISSNHDKVPFAPLYVWKDLVTVLVFFLAISLFVFYSPNSLGHPDNFIPANPLSTPASIVPEWYLLPYYAILRAIPNKTLGVIAMIASLAILLLMPILDRSDIRSSNFRPFNKALVGIFFAVFGILMVLGGKHVEDPYILVGQISTGLYFSWFLIFVPFFSTLERVLISVHSKPY